MSSEELIKNAFEQDIKDLTEERETKGAPTSTKKPKSSDRPLLRPNGIFLRNTIASITASNRRIEENEMRARRKAQLERTPSVCNEGGMNGKETNKEEEQSPNRGKTTTQDGPGEAQLVEEQPDQQGGDDGVGGGAGGGALQRKVRGRGGTGPRVVGLESGVLVESEQVSTRWKNSSPFEPEKEEEEQGRKRCRRSRSNSSDRSSSDSSSKEERRKRRSKKRRKKEKEKRKDDKHKRKEKRRKKEKKEKRRRRREKKSKKEKKSKRSYSSDSPDSDFSS